jgi:hypothetical protein
MTPSYLPEELVVVVKCFFLLILCPFSARFVLTAKRIPIRHGIVQTKRDTHFSCHWYLVLVLVTGHTSCFASLLFVHSCVHHTEYRSYTSFHFSCTYSYL